MRWNAKAARRQMSGRPIEVTAEQFAQRLEKCQSCAARHGANCSKMGGALINVFAAQAASRCPKGKWDGSRKRSPPGGSPFALAPTKTKPKGQAAAAPVWRAAPPPARMEKLIVVTSYWNPECYKRPFENWHQFKNGIEAAGVKLVTIELVLDDDPAQLAGVGVHRIKGRRADHLLWQKERLLNLAIERHAGDADAVAWIDGDILFQNPEWPGETLAALRDNQVVQLFAESFNRMPGGAVEPIRPSCGFNFRHEPEKAVRFQFSHPGFAWAARREWLRHAGGLYDRAITGAGDALMMGAFAGSPPPYLRFMEPCAGWVSDLGEWTRRADTGGAFGYVGGSIVHCYHGSRENRKYTDRQDYLIEDRFDPRADLRLDANGLWAWSDSAKRDKPRMIERVGNYFAERREDD